MASASSRQQTDSVTSAESVDDSLSNRSSSPASKSAIIQTFTQFQREGLAAEAVAAHTKLLQQLRPGGAAQLKLKCHWFQRDREALKGAINTLAIVATLIATFSFTGFLSPPGGWASAAASYSLTTSSSTASFWPKATPVYVGESDTAILAAAPLDNRKWRAFLGFAYSNAIALSTSIGLVLVITVGSIFGWDIDNLLWILLSCGVLLALSITAALSAFLCAAYVIFAPHASLHMVLLSIIVALSLLIAVAIIASLMWKLSSSSTTAAQLHQMQVLCHSFDNLLNTLRCLNSTYATWDGHVLDEKISLYCHNYAICVLASTLPLQNQLFKTISQKVDLFTKVAIANEHGTMSVTNSKANSQACKLLDQFESCIQSTEYYLKVWIGSASYLTDSLRTINWDVGIQLPYYDGCGVGSVNLMHNGWVRLVTEKGSCLVEELAKPSSFGVDAAIMKKQLDYAGAVKNLMQRCKLNPMLPNSIREARVVLV